MNPSLAEYQIRTPRGSHMNLLTWVGQGKYRLDADFSPERQLEYAKKIARIEDDKARKLCLELLDAAGQIETKLLSGVEDFEVLSKALTEIAAAQTEATTTP